MMYKIFLILFLVFIPIFFIYGNQDNVSISAEVLPQPKKNGYFFVPFNQNFSEQALATLKKQDIDTIDGGASFGGALTNWRKYVPIIDEVLIIKKESSWSGIDSTKRILQRIPETPSTKEAGVISIISAVLLIVVSFFRSLLGYIARFF